MSTQLKATTLQSEVRPVSEKKSYIPDKAHEIMSQFHPAPFEEVSKRLGELSRKTLAEAKAWETQHDHKANGEH